MTLKNIDIVSIVTAFQNVDGTLTLPVKVAWIRRLNMRKLTEAKAVIDEAMRDIADRYSDDEHSVEENGQRNIKPEYMTEFVKDQSDILTQETDVDIKKVSIEDLGDIQLTDKQMDTIAFMIIEE